MRAPIALSVALLLAGCGDPVPVATPDAGGGALAIEPPMTPALPVLTPCAEGWRAVPREDGAMVCEPWAADRAPECGERELALPGVGCEPVDTCPADGWPTGLPATRVIYARAGAEPGGDGTRERPFADLRTAYEAAFRGVADTIALAVGEYEGNLEITNIDVVGACATGTRLHSPGTTDEFAGLTVYGAVSLRGLRLSSGYRGLWIAPGAQVAGRELILEGPNAGLRLDSRASFSGERIRISADRTHSRARAAPIAVSLRGATTLTLRRSTIIGGRRGGIGAYQLEGDTLPLNIAVTLEDSSISDTLEGITGVITRIDVRRSVFERVQAGILVFGGSSARLEDVVGRDITSPPGFEDLGSALFVANGTLEVHRAYASRVENIVFLGGDGSDVHVTDAVVDDVRPYGEGRAAIGVIAYSGARVRVERIALSGLDTPMLADEGGALEASDVRASHLRAATGGNSASVLGAHAGGTLRASRVDAVDVVGMAVYASSGGRVEVSDLRSSGGRGMTVQCAPEVDEGCPDGMPSTLEVERARLEHIARVGIAVERAEATLRDVDIDTVAGAGSDGGGYGLYVHGTCDAERMRVRGATLRAVLASHEGTRLDARSFVVDTIQPAACDVEPCDERRGGDGVGCSFGARIALSDFSVRGAYRAGLVVADGCTGVELSRGEISGNAIGVLTDESVGDTSIGLTDVRMEDNVTPTNSFAVSVAPPEIWSE